MILALAINTCESELICDLAEVYHIFDYRALSPDLVAIFVSGLRDDSRTKMSLSGSKLTLEQTLLARVLDEISLLVWFNSEDGAKGKNRPKSVLATLLSNETPECDGVATGDDFQAEWKRRTGG